MKRNKRLLLKAAKRIESIPESYDQSHFAENSEKSRCGTTCCLAGEIIIASEPSTAKGVKKLRAIVTDWFHGSNEVWPGDVAGEIAGLTSDEREKLFANVNGDSWPEKFQRKSKRGLATAAPKLLRYLADGGEI